MKKARLYLHNRLDDFFSYNEVESFYFIILDTIYGYSRKDMLLNSGKVLTDHEFEPIIKIADRLLNNEPIQYILGETEFYGIKFYVDSNVLIPRQETEELVDLIVRNYKNRDPKILDIGTGSGCIPIALKKNIPSSTVFTCDISDEALLVAQKNAEVNQTPIQFVKFDILSGNAFPEEGFDVVVSNPPYVTNLEKALMKNNVLDYEPHLALFVPDNNPLQFYNAIIKDYGYLLRQGGEFYFEINEEFGNEIKQLFDEYNFEAEVINDINDKPRMIRAYRRL